MLDMVVFNVSCKPAMQHNACSATALAVAAFRSYHCLTDLECNAYAISYTVESNSESVTIGKHEHVLCASIERVELSTQILISLP
jgi:hypothetical protein